MVALSLTSGMNLGGRVTGQDSFLHGNTEIKYPENITIGDKVIIGPGVCLVQNLQ